MHDAFWRIHHTICPSTGFFVYRLWRATTYTPFAAILAVFIVARFIIVVTLSSLSVIAPSFMAYRESSSVLFIVIWVGEAITDTLVTTMLVYDLRTRHPVFYNTSRLIDRLIIQVTATGMLTSIYAIMIVICFLSMKDNLIWGGVYFALPRLYSNAMMSSLNARKGIRRVDGQVKSTKVSGVQFAGLQTLNSDESSQV